MQNLAVHPAVMHWQRGHNIKCIVICSYQHLPSAMKKLMLSLYQYHSGSVGYKVSGVVVLS